MIKVINHVDTQGIINYSTSPSFKKIRTSFKKSAVVLTVPLIKHLPLFNLQLFFLHPQQNVRLKEISDTLITFNTLI